MELLEIFNKKSESNRLSILYMGDEQESPEHLERKEKIKGLFHRLTTLYGLSIRAISEVITVPGYDALIDYSRGDIPKNKPDFIDTKIRELEELENDQKSIKELEKLEKKPTDYSNPLNENQEIKEQFINYLPTNSLVLLDLLSPDIAPKPYKAEFEMLGYPFEKAERFVMIGEPNDSKRFKEGEFVIPSRDPAYKGYELAVKRIRIKNCAWGHRYYIWDKFKHAYLVRLYKDQDQKDCYILMHEDSNKFPNKTLHEDDILVVFKVTGIIMPE